MLCPFQLLIIVAHSLTFACSQSTVPSLNNSAIALPLSSSGFTATTSDANNDWYNAHFGCENGGAGSILTRPKLVECTRALSIMHQDDTVRVFSRGDIEINLYQLPKSFESGTCRITISMVPGVTTEKTSWNRIGLDATRLVLSCDGSSFQYPTPSWRTGGKVRTGGSRGILISVDKVPAQSGQVDEDTNGMVNGSSVM